MKDSKTLIYFQSASIVDFLIKNPLDPKTWTAEKKELAKRGGAGDIAGLPPTPSVYEFFVLLLQRKELFTQNEFWKHCCYAWKPTGYFNNLTTEQKMGLQAKAYRNFYPSMIDSLHSWALLSESGKFSTCYLDAYEDVIGKSDITVVGKSGKCYQIALRAKTQQSISCAKYKDTVRDVNHESQYVIPVYLPIHEREIGIHTGNKRWYGIEDFEPIIKEETQEWHSCVNNETDFVGFIEESQVIAPCVIDKHGQIAISF